ncbi:PD-(D/E)XK motif protein [Caballeronia sp. LZ029]|uniref:PD-(D/E)XK motif protein n=1 Tax=Caballeronia sp. LZ029 TaxID=3038564 RepID=UPI002856AD05|nr:PD-(D/E)XK motif protein [Caballeronia sp. LZ029]MDR5744445.1 PD-(D/E)XK motif protein [Caballeronia sp. LZ029]
MARQIKEFVDAWRALSAFSSADGWQTVPVAPAGSCLLRAGRHFPGNEEALLACFAPAPIPTSQSLPRGKGFSVDRLGGSDANAGWLALSRQPQGSGELFSMMVVDVAGALDANSKLDEQELLRIFLGRVRAWQDFMKAGSNVLSPEAELGLIGELCFIQILIEAGIDLASVIESWVGPLDAPQDFSIGAGAIEVKSTLARKGFRAKIGSLDQLDDGVRHPIFFVAARFYEHQSGRALHQYIDDVKQAIAQDPFAGNSFANRLLAAGYLDAHATRYTRRFSLSEIRILHVGKDFPRITHGNVPAGVMNASYEIDVDQATLENVAPVDVLRRLGAL